MTDSVVYLLLETLNQLIDQDADMLLGVEDQLRSFHAELRQVSGFRRNCEGKRKDKEVKRLASGISDLAYEAEDFIDMLALYVSKQRRRSGLGKFVHGFSHSVMLKDAGTKIKSFRDRIREIYDREKGGHARSDKYHEGLRHIEEADGLNFPNEVKSTLVEQLTGGDSRRDVISIIGVCCSGKTTLAMKIYNDDSVKRHFSCRVWVHVSQDCRIEGLLLQILEYAQLIITDKSYHMREKELMEKVSDYLRGKRYLIVMDDLRKKTVWDKVESAFPDNENGSRILFTCRSEDITSHARPTSSHSLSPLNHAQSWELFCKRAFNKGICPPLIEILGRKMTEKCAGLPLSIMLLGSFLARKEQSVLRWSLLADNLKDSLTTEGDRCIDILSYVLSKLPDHLSHCFLYLGMFPEGVQIRANQLIQLWIAEGFIREKVNKKLEDVGEEYLEELIDLSLIQVATRRTDGGAKTCCIPDIYRDFCISKSREKRFLQLQSRSTPEVYSDREKTRGVRSFRISVHTDLPAGLWNSLRGGFKLLRVLNLGTVDVDRVPKEVGKLILLRYIRIKAPAIVHVPASICDLLNLQTLDMRESRLSSLPNGIWKLQQLRHLRLDCLSSIPKPRGTDESYLGSLQTLSGIRPHKDSKRLMIKAKFPNVRKLKLASQNRQDTTEFLKSIDLLYHLQSLKVVSATDLPGPDAFPLTLTKVTLLDTHLQTDHMKTLEKLPNLQILKLLGKSVQGSEINWNAGGFPQLRVLHMVEMQTERWTLGTEAMGSLRHLVIKKCDQLTGLPDGLWSVATLQEVKVFWPSESLRETLRRLVDECGRQILVFPPYDIIDTSTK